ncbi:hypothetical protein ATN88_10040 [Enterovibrio coralii]|uniref:Probable chemoreceptor glutamine deamidase CheD n=2 Tax=Enterovibrio coralii TaxID=294935 RepID=A0A135IAI5_9GAMM|nr:hypothetical protein ATN88_10040 [Enterovibrio coralii]
MREIQVRSGEFQFAYRKPMWMQTVVGTCVTVCIWDQEKNSGGMCHFRLPISPDAIALDDNANDYGSCAIPNLLRKFKQTASRPENLRAWVLGGGQINDGEFIQSQQIGERNVAVSLELLAHYGIPVVGLSVGEKSGRQVRFEPFSGRVDFRLVDNGSEHNECSKPVSKNAFVAAIPDHTASKNWIDNAVDCSFSGFVESFKDLESVSEYADARKPRALIIDAMHLPKKFKEPVTPLGIPAIVVSDTLQPIPISTYKNLARMVGNHIFTSTADSLTKVLESAVSLTAAHNSVKQSQSTAASEQAGLILLGSSTGGVDALETVLSALPQSMPPICIVQHIPKGYSAALVRRLNHVSKLTVVEATDGEEVKAGTVYFAPGGRHLKLVQLGNDTTILRVTDEPPVNGFRPSVEYLFNSALKLSPKNIVAVLMTGMGSDGASSLKTLKEKGALTLIQDEASSTVYGMARVAKEIDAVCRTVPLIGIAPTLIDATEQASTPLLNEEEH